MNEKSVVSKYLEYRENVLKYTNIDMNLEIENALCLVNLT